MTQHFLSLTDLGLQGLNQVLDRADAWKRMRGKPEAPRPLAGKSVVILLEKASTRTRLSFEIGIAELGGHPITLITRDTQLGRGEPLSDTARMLSGYAHAAVYRTAGHDRVEELARSATIPIINGLSDLHHPCQLLADLQTVRAHRGRLDGVRVAWVGDGNNMVHSWIEAAALTGLELRIATPKGYEPSAEVIAAVKRIGPARIELTNDPDEACRGADVVTTDVWASMGQEDEAKARNAAFQGFTVDARRMSLASSDAIFLHCLPAHRGEEVTAEVIDGSASCVWEEAENRLHSQKALLEHLIGG